MRPALLNQFIPKHLLLLPVVVLLAGCGSSNPSIAPVNYSLTVTTNLPGNGVPIQISPKDNNGTSQANTPFTLSYVAGTSVALVAPPNVTGGYALSSWTGCSSVAANVCTVKMTSTQTATANYNLAVAITPNTAVVGQQTQFVAQVKGGGGNAVMWSVSVPAGSTYDAGTIDANGLYTAPYPAPPTVTVTAQSVATPTESGSIVVTLTYPQAANGPALTVDAGNVTHAISPLIYGLNAYALDTTSAQNANITVTRWGGDSTSRYNYQNGDSSSAADWYFENSVGSGVWPTGQFDDTVSETGTLGVTLIGTVPVLGWVANTNTNAYSFPATTYPNQKSFDQNHTPECGDGLNPDGSKITGNDPTVTSISMPPPQPPGAGNATLAWAQGTWSGGWQQHILTKFGPASGGKAVAIWDLDNEPSWWFATHRDVHPEPFTYDEDTNGSIGTALALKTVDPSVLTSGPVLDYWWDYFYSMNDIVNGWGSGPCYQPWQNPVDRTAHGGVPYIEYYLQQFKDAEGTYGKRLLDYVTLHTYFAGTYNGSGTGLTTAGDTAEQMVRMNSTRAFWDPTYTDPNYPQPNYPTDPNYTTSCNVPLQAPQLIPMMKQWVATDYPGTKTSIDEYNFGGLESINGAVTQADILGIFGREGLDMATLWPTTNFNQTVPALMAFAIYRNYDGAKSTFGDEALTSTSVSGGGDGEGQLAVYGSRRSTDNALTIVVINKTYGTLTSTLNLANFTTAATTAEVYQYSAQNLNTIVAQAPATITPPAGGGTASTITAQFPAQSITLFVVPD